MKQTANGLLFSATDLCNFLDCPHLTSLGLTDHVTPLSRDERSEEMQLIANRGHKHEEEVLGRLKAQGRGMDDLTATGKSAEERLAATVGLDKHFPMKM